MANSRLCRLRVGRSCLKSHGFSVNLSLTDKCLCGAVDDNKQWVWHNQVPWSIFGKLWISSALVVQEGSLPFWQITIGGVQRPNKIR